MTLESKEFTPSALTDSIKDFLRSYKDEEKHYKYIDAIDGSINRPTFLLNAKDLLKSEFESAVELYQQLNEQPHDFVEALQRTVKEIFQEHYPGNDVKFEIRIDDVENNISILEALGNKYIERLVCVTGVIVSSTAIFNVPSEIKFRCENGHDVTVILKSNTAYREPSKCNEPKCTSRKFIPVTNKDLFIRHRILYVKSDDDFSHHSDELEIDVSGSLVEIATIGDRVQLTGVLVPRINKQKTYQNMLLAFNVKKLDDVDLRILKEDEEVFKSFPEEPDFYQKMVHSIAPSILGYESVKESLLLQRISSPDILKRDGTKVRGWMHVFLVGDPSTAKTKMCEWEVEKLPRTQIVMSKGATLAGLIMGLEDGPDGRKVLRAGALINCRNGGVAVLDEFPRSSPEAIDGLYTTAENGIAAIAKTGHQTKIRADASLLATGNAHNGKWNEALNVQDNLGMNGVFLQRFDLIWVFIDDFSQKKDAALADAILADIDYLDSVKPYSAITLSKYIKYVQKFKPELTPDVNHFLKRTWLELRADEEAKDNGISPRHLNTLIRITLAIARLYQRQYATVEDANKAINLLRQMFKQRNISISEADTYVQRCLNKALEVLKDEPVAGIRINDLFDKVITYGTEKDQEQAKADLGTVREHTLNRKWREVVETLKRSPLVMIVSEKPLVLAYDKTKGDLRNW